MMGNRLILNTLKLNYLFWFWGLLLLVFTNRAAAQSLNLVHSVAVDRPGAISIDRLSNVYITDARNNLYKFDAQGKLQQTFSPPVTGHLATVEAWSMVKTLLFYDDRQQITLLDRFLTPITSARLSDFTDGIVRAAALAADDRIWLLNESEITLNKIDLRYPDAIVKTQLNQILNKTAGDIRFMREYQNNLYILDHHFGIYVFDNMGTYKKKLPLTNLNYIGFKGDELYYVKENQLVFLNLYTQKSHTVNLPADKSYQKALIGDNFYYFLTQSGLDIYTLK